MRRVLWRTWPRPLCRGVPEQRRPVFPRRRPGPLSPTTRGVARRSGPASRSFPLLRGWWRSRGVRQRVRVVGQELAGRLDPEGDAVEGLGDGIVQVTSQPLALLEGGLAAGFGEQPGVLDGDRRLVGNGPQEDLLVLARLRFREEAEEDLAKRKPPREQRQAVHDVPRRLAHEAMDGRV